MTALAVSNIIGAPLSTGILASVHWFGIARWRWLFILEGLPALVLGVIIWVYLTDRPEQAAWLDAEEREWLAGTIARENAERLVTGHTFWSGVKDGRVWHAAVPPLLGGIALAGAGLVSSPLLAFALIIIATAGIYCFFGPFWTLPAVFLAEATAVVGIATVNFIGNLGGFIGPSLIGVLAQVTGTTGAGLVAVGPAWSFAGCSRLLSVNRNRRPDRGMNGQWKERILSRPPRGVSVFFNRYQKILSPYTPRFLTARKKNGVVYL